VLISHDRYFPRRHGEQDCGNLEQAVLVLHRQLRQVFWRRRRNANEQLQAAYRNQRDRIEQLEVFINRFRYQATKAKQVQSRIKELEKIERIEVPPEEKTIHFSFSATEAEAGRIVAEFIGVEKSYPAKAGSKLEREKKFFRDVGFMIEKGDRIALVGVNGAGKSTLIKLLAGAETNDPRRIQNSVTTLRLITFAQDQYKELDADARMIDDLGAASPRSTQTELRSLLGCFLFSEDDVF